jgi:hypothetical protein
MMPDADARSRLELWRASFETYYQAYFQELLADTLVNHWQRFDEPSRVLIALTTSGSAVSGWALWTEPHMRVAWAFLAGAAAVFATVHATLNVSGRLKDQADLKRRFAALRVEIETLRGEMRVNPNFAVAEVQKSYGRLREKYAETIQLLKNDLLLTRRLENRCQAELDERLSDQIAQAS